MISFTTLATSVSIAALANKCPHTFSHTSFDGGDIASVAVNSSAECCVQCNSHYACAAWTLYQGVCYLKDVHGSNNGTECPECTSGLKQTTNTNTTQCEIHEGFDVVPDGANFPSVPVASPSECCGVCSEMMACQAWTYFGGACYMKSNYSHLQPCPSCISGIMAKGAGTHTRHPLPEKFRMSGITYTGGRYCPNVTMGSGVANASLKVSECAPQTQP